MFYFCFADRRKSASGRKLEKEFSKGSLDRRRLLSNEKVISPSSSSCSESENDTEIEVVLKQSRNRLEETEALKNRHHLLRSEDFVSKMNFELFWTFSYGVTLVNPTRFFHQLITLFSTIPKS